MPVEDMMNRGLEMRRPTPPSGTPCDTASAHTPTLFSLNTYKVAQVCSMEPVDGVVSVSVHGNSTWRYGLFSCLSDWRTTLNVMLCYPCTLSQHFNIIFNNRGGIHWVLCSIMCLFMISTPHLSSLLAQLAIHYYMRRGVRRRYGIHNDEDINVNALAASGAITTITTNGNNNNNNNVHGNIDAMTPVSTCRTEVVMDVLVALCTTSCAMCQHHREMLHRGERPGWCLFPPPTYASHREAPSYIASMT